VADDHGLGHAEPADPARPRFGPGRLDDRRADDADRNRAFRLGERLLGKGLRERVRVGPADARRARPPGLDELVLHPSLAELLGLGRERRRTGRAEFLAGFLAEADELFRLAAEGLGVAFQAA